MTELNHVGKLGFGTSRNHWNF